MRIGHGYDVHKLVEGRKLILGGVEIEYEKGLLGHSDADVLVHALMDSILGAAALGDIGKHFPDSDAQFKDISSMVLLERVKKTISAKNLKIENADVTVIAQRPRLSPFIEKMRENIATCLGCDTARINIKATTTEGLGFEGRGEGISCHAVCLLTEA